MKKTSAIGLLIAFAGTLPTSAEPIYGKLTGINDGDVMDYECVRIPEGKIKCDFVQVLFSKDEPEQDRASFIAVLNDEGAAKNELAEMCAPFDRRDEILAGDTVPEDELTLGARSVIEEMRKAEAETSPEYFAALKASLDALANFCSDPNAKTANIVFDVSDEYAARTCSPWVNRFSQEFRETDEQTWVAESVPLGPCGVVNTSKFVNDGQYPDFWSYFASKIVTNKDGDGILPCDELDENVQPYLWNAPPIFKNCVFFE